MAKESTEIKNLIISHLRGGMFGMEVYGEHEIACHDGAQKRVCVIQVNQPNRWDRYGQIVVYHPMFGKWLANLDNKSLRGMPMQAFTVAEICAQPTRSPMIARVFGVELDTTVAVWDMANC